MKHLCVMFLLLCCTKVTKTAIPKVVAPLNPVHGVVGDDLILPCSLENNVSAVDMEVQWIINGNQLVHKYRRHMDVTDQQLEAYRGRTSLFREELQRGNISLKLRSVNISDTNTYRCYINTNEGTEDASFEVQINELGNEPEISTKSHYNGSGTLECKSTNWEIEPTVEWMDSKGNILEHAENSTYCYDIIQRSVTVQKQHGYNYTCRVSYLHHRKETFFEVPQDLFSQWRHRRILYALLVLLFLICVILPLSGLWSHDKKKKDKCNVLQKYKDSLISTLKDTSLYKELLIIHGHREMHTGEDAPMSSKKDYMETRVEQLFNKQDRNLIILQGEPGHGKSFTAQKIMHDWAQETFTSWSLFDLVVLLKCDELAFSSQAKSLLEIISDNQKYKSLIKDFFVQSPHKVLFLIDGLDEFTFSEEDIKESPTDPFTPASSKAILCGLLRGHILPVSSLLVTTRPFASDRLNFLLKGRTWRFAEIRGFTEERIEEYFQKFFKGENTGVYEEVKRNEMLFASCYNPFLCWITCTALQKSTESSKELVQVGTTTSIFWGLITKLLQQPELQDKRLDFLNHLHEQAKGVIEKRKTEIDLSRYPLQDFDCVFRNVNTDHKEMFRFRHQSLVEFFFALGYVIPEKEGAGREVEELLISAQSDLHSKFHLQPVLKFLFGLSNETVRDSLCSTCGPESSTSSLRLQTQLKEWILARGSILSQEKRSSLFLLHCLYELHDEQFVRKVMQPLEAMVFSYIPLTQTDCFMIKYCFDAHPAIKQLDLRHGNLTAEKLKQLQPVWEKLEYSQLWLSVDGMESTDMEGLIESLEKGISSRPTADGLVSSEIDGLTESLEKRIPSSSSELNEQVSGSEDSKKSVNLQFSSVKSFPLETASKFLSIFQKTNTLFSLNIEVDTNSTSNGNLCPSLSAGTDGLLFTLTVGYRKAENSGTQQTEVLFIRLSLPASMTAINWNEFLPNVQHLTLEDLNWHEDDGHLFRTPDLKKLEIGLTYLPKTWDSDILYYMHKSPSLLDIIVQVSNKTASQEMSVFSSLTLKRDMLNPRSLGLQLIKEKLKYMSRRELHEWMQTIYSLSDPSGQKDPVFRLEAKDFTSTTPTISLIMSTSDDFSPANSAVLLKNILALGETEGNPEDCVKDVLSLSAVTVHKLELKLRCISVGLAVMLLSFMENCKNKIIVSIKTKEKRDDSICSKLYMEKDDHYFKLSVEDQQAYSSGYTAPALTSLTLQSESPFGMDFQKLHEPLNKSDIKLDEYVPDLIPTLNMQKVEMKVKCITVSLAGTVLSYLSKHPIKLSVSIESHETNDEASFCSRLYVKKYDKGFRFSGRLMTGKRLFHQGPGITLKAKSSLDVNWERFLLECHTLEQSNKEELKLPEVGVVISKSDVEEVKLTSSCISVRLAEIILTSLNKHPNKICVSIESKTNGDVDSICSSLYMEKDENGFRLSIGGCRMSLDTNRDANLSEITFKSKSSSDLDWKGLFSNTGRVVDHIFKPNVEKVELKVDCITVSLAELVLSYLIKHPGKLCVSFKTQGRMRKMGFCCSLRMEKDESGFRLSIVGEKVSPPSLFAITFKSISQTADSVQGWTSLFSKIHSSEILSEMSACTSDVDDRVKAFLSSLSNLTGLKEMELVVDSLSDGIKDGIYSLMEACTSLQEFRVVKAIDVRRVTTDDHDRWRAEDETFDFTFIVRKEDLLHKV
ncbi:uncharacterized protein LOC134078819 isoform X2 [Sardina pilchardus]|uniref:uncharacterized protein LOC134078819 isoform X2 n=1 Tax=Sardina pilchardus TaxID=27697 RepID=UPI002E119FE4